MQLSSFKKCEPPRIGSQDPLGASARGLSQGLMPHEAGEGAQLDSKQRKALGHTRQSMQPCHPRAGRRQRGRHLPGVLSTGQLIWTELQAPSSGAWPLALLAFQDVCKHPGTIAPSRNRPAFSVTVTSGISLTTGDNPQGIVFLNPGMKPPAE